ncbi:MAG: hypothetical protein V3S55_13960 [Nitrospiraceae bacterium]
MKQAKSKTRKGWRNGTAKRANGNTGDNACLCGCGTTVKGRFAQGHDARVHSWLKHVEQGERKASTLPAVLRKALKAGAVALQTNTAAVLS